MNEVIEISEREHTKSYSGLTFEPGDHGSNRDYNQLIKTPPSYVNLVNGDAYGSHLWNDALVTRIVAKQPRIVGIDGLSLGAQFTNSEPKMLSTDPRQTWISLPTTPERMNRQEKSVLVVCGDEAFLGEEFNYPKYDYPEMQAIREALNEKVMKDYDNFDWDINKEAYGLLATTAVITAALGVKEILAKKPKKKDKTMSRRNLLQLAVAGIATTAAGAYAAAKVPALEKTGTATTQNQKEKWLDIIDIVAPKVITSKLLNMRTALVTLKTKDAIDEMGLPQDVSSSVIMGTRHSINAHNFLKNDDAAQQAVLEYVKAIDPILTKALAENPGVSREDAVAKIKRLLAQTYVQKVDEPDHDTFNTPNLEQAVQDATKTVGDFQSSRVLTALEQFN